MNEGIIVLDVGTTETKASIFAKNNDVLIKNYSKNTNVITKEDTSEIDMNELWTNVKSLLTSCFTYSNQHNYDIESICVTGQGEGLWVLDTNGTPFMNAILWNDNRAKEVVDSMKETDQYVEIKKELGSYIKPGSTLSLLKWLKLHDYEAYMNIGYIFSCKDFIRYKLTGAIHWELSDASCSMMNLQSKEYAYTTFDNLDMHELKDKLPKTVSSTTVTGVVEETLLSFFETKGNIDVYAGSIDIVANMFGLGMKNSNDLSITIGTTGMLLTNTDTYVANEQFNGWEISIDGKFYVYGMGTMAAVPNANHFYQLLNITEEDYHMLNEKLLTYKPFESGILYLPFISTGGERAPFFNPNIKAQLMGLSFNNEPYDVIHAIYEGIAFSIYDCINSLVVNDVKDLYLTGGLSKSEAFRKILSDVIGKNIYYIDGFESASHGAYRIARSGDALHDINPHYNTVACNAENHARYKAVFKLYKDAIKNNQEFWEDRAQLLQ